MEFAGRGDQQVKIRGYRIELGEIEARLLEHPAVQEAIVLAREAGTGDMQIVAYLVHRENVPDTTALREFLKERLPEYMIPSATVVLPGFPLTPNGKVDRKALPMPDVAGQLAHQYVAPRSPTEELLCGIWTSVLQVTKVGVHDNFFDLGGHSLLATQVMARLREVFRVDLPMRVLFETATVAKLAAVLTSLETADHGLEEQPIIPIERSGKPIPLSFAQQRLWVLTQIDPNDASYHIPLALRLSGALEISSLERSFSELIRRHEVLRTTFGVVDGRPIQVIAPSFPMLLPIVELTHLTEVEQEAVLRRLAASEAQRPFDLVHGPMIRASVIRLSDDEHVLLLTMHHIVSDGWSADIIVRELTTLYEDHLKGRPSSLPDLPIQYADFSWWQQQWLSGKRMERQLSYWKDVLNGEVPLLDLPTDHPRPTVRTSHGASLTSNLSPELSVAVKEFSRREGVTQYMALLGAFYLLLFRYSGQQDLIVGSPIANRTRKEIEGLIGFFVNTLALRVDVSGNPTIREIIGRVRNSCLGAYSHQDVPFEKLVEVLQPVRDVSRSPLFQVMFDMQNHQPSEVGLPGLNVTPLEIDNQTAKFDLTLTIQETEQGLICSIEYNTDLFEETTIQRMLTHFQTLLEGMVTGPETLLSELPVLPKSEQQQLLVDWNNTTRAYPQAKCLHELIEEQAEKTPNGLAVVCGNQSLTYRELNQRANQLAHYLRHLGIGPDVLVGVCMERSVEMVVSLLGTLKAGGSYVPIDPDYPPHRIVFMLQDIQPALLLTQRRLVGQLEGYAGLTLCPDTDWPLIADQPLMNPQLGLSPLNLAYTIYTSGSTGRPKGVGNTHLGLLNRLQWMQDFFRLQTTDRVLQKTPFSFDVSVWEFFWPLMVGAGLVVAGPGEHRNPARLIELIKEHQVTTTHFVPPMLHVFLETAGVDACRCLSRVICSGEALSAELQRRLFMQLPWAELHNLYGPTEAAIDVTAWRCERDDDAASVPIGRPIANTQLYVLDRQNQPVPVGVAGELHIGGIGVARGYHRRPELTAEKFVPDPFSKIPGSRLYKTGDLARYRQDGVIDYIGRLDHQVKIRGFRIELGEIEAWLSKHPDVREVVVLAREDPPDGKRLVAYIVPTSTPSRMTPTANDLRQFLSEQLPEYMIPAAFLFLAELPRTANGKIDRKLLPAPDFNGQLTDQYVAPRTAIEGKLADMWAEVLGIMRIGVHDNFFDHGGHSLLAVQLMSRIRKTIGSPLSLLAIFQAPTVASLAELLSKSEQDISSSLVVLRDTGTRLPLYCFDPDGTHVLAYQSLAYSLDDEQPVYGVSLSGIFSMDWKSLSLAAIAENHARLIRQHQPEGPYQLLGWSNGGVMALAVAHALERQDQIISFLGILDTQPRSGILENPNVLDELVAYVSRDRQHEFLALPEEERQALQECLIGMAEEDRVEYAIQWAQDRGFLSQEESETSIDILKVGYALDKETNRTLRAYRKVPLSASIHAWWTTATLARHGKAPVDWTLYTRGTVEVGTIVGEHTDAVQGIEIHQRISETLAQVCDVKKESYAVQP
ncbi:amino acid adenylation domain-containing protein [Nitrospira sp. BLG_2]|uniref:amino acid adenylation domain-containing protein n=1 Tax=Nitrospira sp. BLG_2 TaxID=3397507 RepID=UPI003B9A7136